jgi:hypothetical protein
MTTLENRPNTALLVVDVQNGVVRAAHERDAVVANGRRRPDRRVHPLHPHGAIVRGCDATLVSDAQTTEDQTAWGAPPPDQVIAHTSLYWTYHAAPGRAAGTVETETSTSAAGPDSPPATI